MFNERLSSKSENMLTSALRGSMFTGYNVFSETTDKIPTTEILVDHCAGVFNQHIDSRVEPSAIRPLTLLLSPHQFYKPAQQYLREVSLSDIDSLVNLSVDISKDPTFMENVIVRTVLGGSEEIPLRSLGYVLPALQYVEGLRLSGKFSLLPQIQFCCMADTGASINGLDQKKAREQAELFARVGEAYIKHYHPALAHMVRFVIDKVFFGDESVQQLVTSTVWNIRNTYGHMLQTDMLADLDALDRNESLTYALFHPIVHDMALPDYLFPGINTNPSVIINIGGQFEKRFYRVRQVCKSFLPMESVRNSVQLFTRHTIPPYFPLENSLGTYGKDISLQDVLSRPSIIEDVLTDTELKGTLLHREIEMLYKNESDLEYFFEKLKEGI